MTITGTAWLGTLEKVADESVDPVELLHESPKVWTESSHPRQTTVTFLAHRSPLYTALEVEFAIEEDASVALNRVIFKNAPSE